MSLTYRTKRRLYRAGLIGAILLLVVILVGFCWVTPAVSICPSAPTSPSPAC